MVIMHLNSNQGAGLDLVPYERIGNSDREGYIGNWRLHQYTSTRMYWRQKCG